MLVRLKKNYEFARVFKHGKRYVGRHIAIHVRKNHLSYNRFGFTTLKHFGKATRRNQMKRYMREATYAFQETMYEGYDIILMGRVLDEETSFQTIKEDLGILLTKAKVREQ